MARTLLASLLPAVAVTAAWLSLEEPQRLREGVAVAALAVLPALVHGRVRRLMAIVLSAVCSVWIAFAAQPWEVVPFRDERVLAPVVQDVVRGVVDFYAVFLPFEPSPNPEMHSLVLFASFGFVLATALLVAARRALGAAAVTVAGVGWPATLLGGTSVAVGAVALVAALSIPLILRASSVRSVVVGGLVGAVVVAGAASTSSATTLASSAALNWETWEIRGKPRQAREVRFIWDSNYKGIAFPAKKTVVLRVEGPSVAQYWRTTTLDLFDEDHWFEHLFWLEQVDRDSRALQLPQLIPPRAQNPDSWLEQAVHVEALVDDHLAAAGTPVALDARRLGTVYRLSGGVLRARDPVGDGESYRVWSYAPDPAPRSLAQAPAQYPAAATRFLEIDGRVFPRFGAPNRARSVRLLFADRSFRSFARHQPMYAVAQRIAGRAETPYATVLALEAWLRQTGGFRYDESPPGSKGMPPLVGFVTQTKAGYCQHFAGAMAAMLRMLGIPSRVAVGFTSGMRKNGAWVVTDHDAHAWVEVWFSGLGWIPFDPTPGRGTLGGEYSFASGSEDAVAALRRGELDRSRPESDPRGPDLGDPSAATVTSADDQAPSLVAVGLALAVLWVIVLGLAKVLVRRARYLSRDPRRLATASRRELEDFLRDQGVNVAPNATLAALQKAVRDTLGIDGRPFARAAASARFGPPGAAARGRSSAQREVRQLIRLARRRLSLWARFRGLVSLRSLRHTSIS